MKICILTQPLGTNYGGILQAYALQKVLRDMGHDVTTLRFRPDVPWVPSGYKKHLLTLRRFVSKYIKGNNSIVYCNPDRQTRFAYRELDRFIDTQMHCLEVKAPLSFHDLPTFDTFIVGSDQVWRPAYSPCLPNFYLDFLGNAPAKRIAYAASFGVDIWEADEEMTTRIRPLAQQFDAISVREKSGINLCKEHLGVHAKWMPDPTFLLSANDYLNLCHSIQTIREPYIAAYILDKEDEVLQFVDRVAKELKLPVKNFGHFDWSTCSDSPEFWIDVISHASFVLTDSFHGTVFSLLFERPFLTLINSERGTSRFTSLLDSVGLRNRLIEKKCINKHKLDIQHIPFESVRESILRMRNDGLLFLRNI